MTHSITMYRLDPMIDAQTQNGIYIHAYMIHTNNTYDTFFAGIIPKIKLILNSNTYKQTH